MAKKIKIAGYKIKVWTLSHAFRDEMSQIVHWTILGAVATIVGLQISTASAAVVSPVNEIYTLFM